MEVISKINIKNHETCLKEEWLVTNGTGGFACGSLGGTPMRRYHSLLNASLPAPYGRTNMLNYVADSVVLPDHSEILLSPYRASEKEKPFPLHLVEFRLENGLPVWKYDINGILLEKGLFLIHRQNTLHMYYKLLSEHEGINIKWHPFFHFRKNEHPVDMEHPEESYTVQIREFQYDIECPNFPPLRIYNDSKANYVMSFQVIENYYEFEAERGYEHTGFLKSPGFFFNSLSYNERTTFIVSTESWNAIFALSSSEAWRAEKIRKNSLLKSFDGPITSSLLSKLILAADQFIIVPTSRYEDMLRLQALGEEARTIIAGFPWFTDWGRDTMISLEGLTLITGRSKEAYSILHTFAYYVRDGLIPNMFPEGEMEGIYNTADATLWFFHAIDRYIAHTQDHEILEFILPKLHEIIHYHIKGTKFGIKMDEDGLLTQGMEGFQLTWMDAKVGDWVVTPRRGKAVEINALWYNALKLFEKWTGKPFELSERCYHSFNERFWIEKEGYLYDVVDGEGGNDAALRPNQLLSISLSYPVLDRAHWEPVFNTVTEHLLTPVGLRTLAPFHPDYKSTYDGDLRARDASYHQGTVWPWLLGPYVDVLLKVYPKDVEKAHAVLKSLEEHLETHCIGTIGEIFDASPPFRARGCFAQAWSVAEILRCVIKLSTLGT